MQRNASPAAGVEGSGEVARSRLFWTARQAIADEWLGDDKQRAASTASGVKGSGEAATSRLFWAARQATADQWLPSRVGRVPTTGAPRPSARLQVKAMLGLIVVYLLDATSRLEVPHLVPLGSPTGLTQPLAAEAPALKGDGELRLDACRYVGDCSPGFLCLDMEADEGKALACAERFWPRTFDAATCHCISEPSFRV